MNIATIAAIIAAVTAIIAPTITAIINQSGIRRLKREELFWSEKVKAYSEFLSETCKFQHGMDLTLLESTTYRASLFSSNDTAKKIENLTRSIARATKNGDIGDVPEKNAEALTAMQKEIQEYRR